MIFDTGNIFNRLQNFYTLITFIGIRFIRSRYKQFIFAIIGVGLGVSAYIVSASIMFGYEKYFINQVIEIEPHIVIRSKIVGEEIKGVRDREERPKQLMELIGFQYRERGEIVAWQDIVETLSGLPGLLSLYPRMEVRALVRKGEKERGATLIGIDPYLEIKNNFLCKFLKSEDLEYLQLRPEGTILGVDLAQALGIEEPGQRVSLILPNGNFFLLTVLGFFETGITSIDISRAFVNLKSLQNMVGKGSEINTIALYLEDPRSAETYSSWLQGLLRYEVEPWTKAFANFLRVLKTQNFITMLIVSVILIVSSFGIFGINLMIVLEKRKEIAIMQAIGLSQYEIIAIFLSIGVFISIIGYLIGSLLSIILIKYLSMININMGSTIKLRSFVIDNSIKYYIEAFLYALFFTIIASIYPAYRAGKINPVEIFRNL